MLNNRETLFQFITTNYPEIILRFTSLPQVTSLPITVLVMDQHNLWTISYGIT